MRIGLLNTQHSADDKSKPTSLCVQYSEAITRLDKQEVLWDVL